LAGCRGHNILDDSLSVDREKEADPSPLLTERIVDLACYARKIGAEFAEEAARLGTNAKLTSFLVEPAMAALKGGDASTHNQLVAERASALGDFESIVLAHFSTARAAPMVRECVGTRALSSPETAVAKLRR
jgi:hypothetical protein